MDSTPAVGSVCLATAWKRPEKSGAVSQHDGFVLLNRKSTRRSVGQRTRVAFEKASGAGLEPAGPFGRAMYSKPAAECVSMCCLIEVVMQKRDRRSCDQRVLRCSTTELRRCVSEKQLRRWDSNPRHPAPEACTPNRQSIVCVCAISVSSSKSSASASTPSGCGPDRAGPVAAVVCR